MSNSGIKGEGICYPCGYYITDIPLTGNHWHNDIVNAEVYECDGIQTCPGCGRKFSIMVVDDPESLILPPALVKQRVDQ